jgi:putative spermidine/putrescine transport system permease protein
MPAAEVRPLAPRATLGRLVRALGVVGLVGSAVIPVCLLGLWSMSGAWFYPSLLPMSWSSAAWIGLFGGGSLAGAALTSIGLGLGVGAVGCAIAVPIGRMLAGLESRYRHIAVAAVMLPAAAPPIAVATGLQLSFVTLGLAGTVLGVACAHLIPVVGVLSFFFFAVFATFDRNVEEEARSLGATPFQVWVRVILPLLRGELLAAFAIGFILSWGQVPLTLIIGSGAVRTLAVDVLAYASAGEQRYAAAGALLLLLPAAVMVLVTRAFRQSSD